MAKHLLLYYRKPSVEGSTFLSRLPDVTQKQKTIVTFQANQCKQSRNNLNQPGYKTIYNPIDSLLQIDSKCNTLLLAKQSCSAMESLALHQLWNYSRAIYLWTSITLLLPLSRSQFPALILKNPKRSCFAGTCLLNMTLIHTLYCLESMTC